MAQPHDLVLLGLLHWRAQFASLLFVTHYGGESDYAEAKQCDNAPEQF
jgi:hypothetical protein